MNKFDFQTQNAKATALKNPTTGTSAGEAVTREFFQEEMMLRTLSPVPLKEEMRMRLTASMQDGVSSVCDFTDEENLLHMLAPSPLRSSLQRSVDAKMNVAAANIIRTAAISFRYWRRYAAAAALVLVGTAAFFFHHGAETSYASGPELPIRQADEEKVQEERSEENAD